MLSTQRQRKMAESKKSKMSKSASKKKATKVQTKAAEYVGYLLELHRLQGILLNRLDKEV
jgi:hypothetical protein